MSAGTSGVVVIMLVMGVPEAGTKGPWKDEGLLLGRH